MTTIRTVALVAIAWSVCGAATAQSIQSKRAIEFRLAEYDGAPGLIAVHVSGEARVVHLHTEVILDDRDVRTASVVKGPDGDPAVQVHLRPEAVKRFNEIATGGAPRMVAVVAHGRVISTPVMVGPMIDDLLDISGALTAAEASSLARALAKRK
jgi:preprotein translocase subunit SecD